MMTATHQTKTLSTTSHTTESLRKKQPKKIESLINLNRCLQMNCILKSKRKANISTTPIATEVRTKVTTKAEMYEQNTGHRSKERISVE